ncbi:hypothetical protein V5799_003290 [Amblyomma americanum]|uniref:Uncharacterized protein n=1 Tax=Amblyomma americanum TaxID=6943 RepID=A0AAQ4D9D8_AMBAM
MKSETKLFQTSADLHSYNGATIVGAKEPALLFITAQVPPDFVASWLWQPAVAVNADVTSLEKPPCYTYSNRLLIPPTHRGCLVDLAFGCYVSLQNVKLPYTVVPR